MVLGLRFGGWSLGFGISEFGISSLVIWIWDFEFGVCFAILEFRILH